MNDDAAQHPTGAELTIDDGSSLFTGRVGEFLSPEMLYRTLVEQIPVVTFIELMDGGGVPHFLSPQIETLLGHPPHYWQERPSRWIEAIHPDDLPAWQAELERTDRTGDPFELEHRMLAADGRAVWVRSSARLVYDSDGQPRFWQGILQDISDRKELEDQLRHLAFHDPLTGLPNRLLFMDRLEQALAGLTRHTRAIALFFIDLDEFKTVNDTWGHDIGDQVLIRVSEMIQSCVRAGDTVSRLGGDEFTVLLIDVDGDDEATRVAERLLEKFEGPLRVAGHAIELTASIGVVVSHSPDEDPGTLVYRADLAMYQAKAAGRSRYRVFPRPRRRPHRANHLRQRRS